MTEPTSQIALIQAGFVTGVVDADGYVESVDSDRVGVLVATAIRSLKLGQERADG